MSAGIFRIATIPASLGFPIADLQLSGWSPIVFSRACDHAWLRCTGQAWGFAE